jgi:hypothetical protein
MALEHRAKAHQLVDDFYFNTPLLHYDEAIKVAELAVDEIIKSNPTDISCVDVTFTYAYWNKVKNELTKMKNENDK